MVMLIAGGSLPARENGRPGYLLLLRKAEQANQAILVEISTALNALRMTIYPQSCPFEGCRRRMYVNPFCYRNRTLRSEDALRPRTASIMEFRSIVTQNGGSCHDEGRNRS